MSDAGNILDFLQRRQNLNLGEVRKELRPWLNGSAGVPKKRGGDFDQPLLPITKDKADRYARLATMQGVTRSQFLNQMRAIPEAVTASARFAGRIYQDQRRNAVFPHYDLEGMCGYEIRIRTKNLERIVELSKAFPSLAEQGSVKSWDAMASR